MPQFDFYPSFLAPVEYLLLAILFFHLSLHSNYALRLPLLFPFLYFATLSFIASDRFLVPNLTSLWAQSVILNMIQVISLLLIENYPAPQSNNGLSVLHPSALLVTWRIWSNPRMLPEARKATQKMDASAQEPRSLFVLLRLAKLSLYYSIHVHILPALFTETILEIFPLDVSESALFSRLGEVSARETLVRSYVAVSWIWESVVFLDGANAILSLLAVLSGLDSPEDWPPMFGGIDEIRGLRSFWARFWHRLALRPYRTCGRAVSFGLASLSGINMNKWGSSWVCVQAQSTVVAFVVFLLSGLSHAAVSWRLGMRDWLDVQWFLLNFMACSVEIYGLTLLRYLAGRFGLTKQLNALERSWLGKFIGYLWVFAFFFWSVPLWKFPRMHSTLTAAEKWKSIWSKMKVCGDDVPCF